MWHFYLLFFLICYDPTRRCRARWSRCSCTLSLIPSCNAPMGSTTARESERLKEAMMSNQSPDDLTRWWARVEAWYQQAQGAPVPTAEPVAEAFEELSVAWEELRAAQEEVERQQEALA